ncbi:MAG: cell division protein ZapA [Candidatus Kryptoniota bacterium]
MDKKSIRVTILGKEYPLRVDDEEKALKVVSYVDSLLNELLEKNPGAPTSTIAVIAALNIAEQLFDLKEKVHNEGIDISDLVGVISYLRENFPVEMI